MKTSKEYKALLNKCHESKATLADIERVMAWWTTGKCFDIVEATRLYNHHSPEYCVLLELLHEDFPHIVQSNICADGEAILLPVRKA